MEKIYQLLAGIDGNKDQSYFYAIISRTICFKALFPIGELTKPQVREIVLKLDLITAEKRNSQDYVSSEKCVCLNFTTKITIKRFDL